VYVQGLSETNDPGLVVLFDKIAAPPDHCHFPRRLWAGFVREVCFVDGSWRTVPLEAWSGFALQQIDLLVEAGFDREHAARLYSEVRWRRQHPRRWRRTAAPPLRSMLGGNQDAPFMLHLAFPAAVAQRSAARFGDLLPVGQRRRFAARYEPVL